MLEVFAIDDCRAGGYIEMNLLEGTGAIVGISNDIIPSMRKGELYRAKLLVFEDTATQFRLTEARCHDF